MSQQDSADIRVQQRALEAGSPALLLWVLMAAQASQYSEAVPWEMVMRTHKTGRHGLQGFGLWLQFGGLAFQ